MSTQIPVEGAVVAVQSIQTAKGKTIATVIVHTGDNNYGPEHVAVKCFEPIALAAGELTAGSTVKVLGHVSSRAYGDKWYTDFIADRLVVTSKAAATPGATPAADDSDLPF